MSIVVILIALVALFFTWRALKEPDPQLRDATTAMVVFMVFFIVLAVTHAK